MTTNNSTLTQERLKEVLHYSRETGIFTWLITANRNGAAIGDEAGWLRDNGYRMIAINGVDYRAHRLAWFYIYGEWPEQIDHKDHIRRHNWIDNLRDVSSSENGKNQSIPKRNKSGIIGVRWHAQKCKWHAQIGVDMKKIHLGYFTCIEDAAEARKEAEIKYGFHENHGLPR